MYYYADPLTELAIHVPALNVTFYVFSLKKFFFIAVV